MNEEDLQIEDEPIFPEKSSSVIEELLEKYGLIKNWGEEDNLIDKIVEDPSKTAEEKRSVLENHPGAKLAKLVADYGYQEISIEKIPRRIEKEFEVDLETAKKMTNDLNSMLLALIKVVEKVRPIEKKGASVDEYSGLDQKTTPPINALPKEKRRSSKKDSYLEPIE